MKNLNEKLLEAEKEMKIAIANYDYYKKLSEEQSPILNGEISLSGLNLEELRDIYKNLINSSSESLTRLNSKIEVENAILNYKLNHLQEYSQFEEIKNILLRDASFLIDSDILIKYRDTLEKFVKNSDSVYESNIFEKYVTRADVAIRESINLESTNNVSIENSQEYLGKK